MPKEYEGGARSIPRNGHLSLGTTWRSWKQRSTPRVSHSGLLSWVEEAQGQS